MKSKIDLYKYSSHERCNALINHYEGLELNQVNNRAFWRDLSSFWHTMDCINHAAIERLMYLNHFRKSYLSKQCQQAIDDLFPTEDLITIYRGQNDNETEISASGLAWTTDIDVAVRFAKNGIRGRTSGKPYLLQTDISFMQVAMAFNERDEAEVVLFTMELESLFNNTTRINL